MNCAMGWCKAQRIQTLHRLGINRPSTEMAVDPSYRLILGFVTLEYFRLIAHLIGGLEHFIFCPIVGMMIQSDFHSIIFQGGRVGLIHQPVMVASNIKFKYHSSDIFSDFSVLSPRLDATRWSDPMVTSPWVARACSRIRAGRAPSGWEAWDNDSRLAQEFQDAQGIPRYLKFFNFHLFFFDKITGYYW